MNIAILSLHDEKYKPLADMTWTQNKEKYAEKHGYMHACKTDNFYGITIGFEKIWFIKEMFEAHPNVDWIWWTGCDTLVTNMNIKLEDRIDKDYHLILATDCHNFNVDSFFMRNSPEMHAYLQMIMDLYPKYANHNWAEQQAMIDTYEDHKSLIKIVPQKSMNSYDCRLYPHQPAVDQLGTSSDWTPGDLLIHWPGTTLPMRMQLAAHYLGHVEG
jgi:hypothetical protein